jgi:hypothetical protein
MDDKLIMDFTNRTVSHKLFGVGTVTGLDGDSITVSFSAGEKKFIFPDAFIEHIDTEDMKSYRKWSDLITQNEF